jgi:alpha-galactosidase
MLVALASLALLVLAVGAYGAEAPAATEQYGILTPPPPAEPRITGPRLFGVRPGHPFLFTVTATGEGPITLAAKGLPQGLAIDEKTGCITGAVKKQGEYAVTLSATSAKGATERPLRIVVGRQIALTPPMGWNSWNCWAGSVDEKKVRAAAQAMVSSGLASHGWTYINIDDAWQGARPAPDFALQPNEKFPDMKGLADYVHGLGLRIGLYSTPWKTSYANYAGGSADDDAGRVAKKEHAFGAVPLAGADARQWAAWGVDYLKYDWNPIDIDHTHSMAEALWACGRDIVFSLSNSAPFDQAKSWGAMANCWRTTGDITDTWESVAGIGFDQDRWRPFAGPGHWNDPDMLVVGRVGWGPKLHPTQLTPNEQLAHISLWCLLSAPLLLGCDLAELDDFTRALLTNDEVLDVDQDPLGRPAGRAAKDGDAEVWAKDLADGSKAVGLFNRGAEPRVVTVKWSDLGISGKQQVRDLWQQKDLGAFDEKFETRVLVHGCVLVKIAAAK